ncbi:DedA family protein [Dictyobacter aurantiacus]|uniref:DedA family protein n=1 Tax=Dictyobacter aurantiacus TaxID=1936993 RepID=A0A401ZJ32_9CHLR|nr:DedA family protein [Dictyobacter aurantiacus]GCE06850.1 DedA family protein [Dictyobacter aurantiacus]
MRKLPSLIGAHLFGQPGMTLASFNILQFLQNFLHTLGYPAVVLVVMVESAGVPVPGETMLLLASFYAAVYHDLSLPIVIACAAVGAILGDNVGYGVGRTGGKAFVHRYGRYVFLKPERLQRSEEFFARHGNKTVFFGRFVAVLRAFAAFLAGVNRMHWPTFLAYNAAGGIIWATIYGLLGYYAGRVFHDNFTLVEHLASNISLVLGAVIVLGAIIAFFVYKKRKDNAPQSSR